MGTTELEVISEIFLYIKDKAGIGLIHSSNYRNDYRFGERLLTNLFKNNEVVIGDAVRYTKEQLINEAEGSKYITNDFLLCCDASLELGLPLRQFLGLLPGWPVYLREPVTSDTISAELPEQGVMPPGSGMPLFSSGGFLNAEQKSPAENKTFASS